MLDPYLVDERDVNVESLGEQTYRIEVWIHPSPDGSWQAVAVYETRAGSVREVIDWAIEHASAIRPARILVGVVTESGPDKTFLKLHEQVF